MAQPVSDANANRPLPTLTEWNRPFFAAGLEGELKLQRCADCGFLIYYPRPMCHRCGSTSLNWERMSGLGMVFSYTKIWVPEHPFFRDQVPFLFGAIQLDEGPQMFARLQAETDDEVRIGSRVEVTFEMVLPEIALPLFRVTPFQTSRP